MLQNLAQDIRFALRLVSRNRWTSATIVATLTVGIALNISVFTRAERRCCCGRGCGPPPRRS